MWDVPRRSIASTSLTRRRLLSGAAGLLGASSAGLLGRGVAAAAAPMRRPAAPVPPRVFGVTLGALPAGISAPVAVGRHFELAGVGWTGSARAPVWVRTRRRGGAWSPWADASVHGHTAAAGEQRDDGDVQVGDPVWTGAAEELQLRLARPLRAVRLALVDTGATAGRPPAAGEAALALAEPVLEAGPGQPAIIARRVWSHGLPAHGTTLYGALRLAFVHHTETPNGYARAEVPAILRGVYAFHVHVRGWKDIGYNFVIDRFGRVWEARAGGIDEPVVGAQAGGYNAVSSGVAILGSYGAQVISPAARRALVQLLAWKLSLHGVAVRGRTTVTVDPAGAQFSRFPGGAQVSLPRVAGHRDADSTDCPGDALYHELGGLRGQAATSAGRPLRATLTVLRAPVTAPGPITVQGTLAYLDGSPLAGAPVTIQARQAPPAPLREVDLAQATTDPGGTFAAAVPADRDVSLRALYAGGAGTPASVSAPVDVSVAPAIILQVGDPQPPPGSPVALTGTVSPAKAQVRVALSAVAPGGTTRLSTTVLDASTGSFAASIALPGPGDYRLQAFTATDRLNGAGASIPVEVSSSG